VRNAIIFVPPCNRLAVLSRILTSARLAAFQYRLTLRQPSFPRWCCLGCRLSCLTTEEAAVTFIHLIPIITPFDGCIYPSGYGRGLCCRYEARHPFLFPIPPTRFLPIGFFLPALGKAFPLHGFSGFFRFPSLPAIVRCVPAFFLSEKWTDRCLASRLVIALLRPFSHFSLLPDASFIALAIFSTSVSSLIQLLFGPLPFLKKFPAVA